MWSFGLVVGLCCLANGFHLFHKPLQQDRSDEHADIQINTIPIEELSVSLVINSDVGQIQVNVVDTIMQSIEELPELPVEKISNLENVSDSIDQVFKQNQTETVVPSLHFKPNMTAEQVRSTQGLRMTQIMDLEADPCEDFYRYACGNWDVHNPLPADTTGYDTFEKLRETLNLILRSLLNETTNVNEDLGSGAILKAKHLYQSCMNLDKLEERKETPLLELLQDLGGWPMLSTPSETSISQLDWVDLMAQLRLYNNDILISMWVGLDGKNSDSHIIQLDQGDLALPNRGYYLGQDNSTKVLDAYSNFIRGTALALGGRKDIVDRDVDKLLEFEIELAKILTPAEERRNFSAMYRKMTISELSQLVETIPWERYLSQVLDTELYGNETVVVYATEYFLELAPLLNTTDERTLKNYLLWRFVRHRLNNLDRRFQDLKQELYAVLYGREQQPERWKYCVSYVNANMGMAVGSLFVKNFFSEESKNDTTKLIFEMQDVFTYMLNSAEWLDYDTKDQAKDKLNNMNLKVGYPDYILKDEILNSDYEEIDVDRESYFENVLKMLKYAVQEEIKKLNKSVDRQQWSTAPAVVNAYYSRSRNQIMLPAGILQPPFYHSYFPKAVNYGGIGVVIGHEITHGFDDQGRQFDSNGNLRSWWPEEAITNFEKKTRCIIEQYSNYMDQVGDVEMPVNGINTQGENIADNGGIRQAFKAYERWLDKNPEAVEQEVLPGLNATAKQLFFLSFGQIWCGTIRPEAAVSKMKTAVHAPGRFRVIGSLSNLEEFSEVYGCTKGSLMNPLDKCVVW